MSIFCQKKVSFCFLAKTNLGSRLEIIYLGHGPYGPQGPWAQPLFDCVAVPSGFFFSAKTASQKNRMRIYSTNEVFLIFFAILANIDLNLKLKICKIAI